MTDFEEVSSKVECVKIAMNQDKNGFVLKLSLHPNDTPEDLLRDPVGTRYLAVLVRIDAHEQPVAAPATEEGLKAIKIAGTMCSDYTFQEWMVRKGYAEDMTEVSVAAGMRKILRVASRKELKVDAKARQRLLDLRGEFVEAMRQGQQHRRE